MIVIVLSIKVFNR